MSGAQNLTQKSEPTEVPIPFEMLKPQQQMWVDYTALGGLITNEDGSVKKMSVSEFAQQVDVSRETLYAWRKSIPNFWDLVGTRTGIIFSQTRTTKVINAWYLGATVKLNPQLIAMWMANQKLIDFHMPQQEVKHEAGNSFAALAAAKRARQAEVIEGEVVDDTAGT